MFSCEEGDATEDVEDEFLKRRDWRPMTVKSSRLNDKVRRGQIVSFFTKVEPCLTDKDGRDGFRRTEKLT